MARERLRFVGPTRSDDASERVRGSGKLPLKFSPTDHQIGGRLRREARPAHATQRRRDLHNAHLTRRSSALRPRPSRPVAALRACGLPRGVMEGIFGEAGRGEAPQDCVRYHLYGTLPPAEGTAAPAAADAAGLAAALEACRVACLAHLEPFLEVGTCKQRPLRHPTHLQPSFSSSSSSSSSIFLLLFLVS